LKHAPPDGIVIRPAVVAFTPKGGCPLKLSRDFACGIDL